jgi:hypothetical protein
MYYKNKCLKMLQYGIIWYIFIKKSIGLSKIINRKQFMGGYLMKETVKNFEIEYLVHFTQCENLVNIFKHGLLPRKKLVNNKISSKMNDEMRLDGFEDATCLSISFPNYKMLNTLRLKNENIDWAVIGVNKRILWEKDCAFCRDNAASKSMTSIDISIRKTKESFCSLFDEYPGKVKRVQLGIDNNMTTNPQSEVLVFDEISPKDILGVIFYNEKIRKKYAQQLPNDIKTIVERDYFYGRCDYNYWR